jgi:hypothetical protein
MVMVRDTDQNSKGFCGNIVGRYWCCVRLRNRSGSANAEDSDEREDSELHFEILR